MNTHLAIYEEFGLKAQWRHLGEPHAYMFAESGAMNSLVHQWVYKDAVDRETRRAAMANLCEEAVRIRPADGAADLADGAGKVRPADEEIVEQERAACALHPPLEGEGRRRANEMSDGGAVG